MALVTVKTQARQAKYAFHVGIFSGARNVLNFWETIPGITSNTLFRMRGVL